MTHSPVTDDSLNTNGHSSPSEFHSSVETSPAIIPLPEPSVSDGGHSPAFAATRPPFQHRNSLDLHRSASTASRGGCWYACTKCDEQREEGDSCRTCRRLQLNCLGWGPRRPDWMRDKEAVQNYKTEIKAHLLRLGLIRGQPRTSLAGGPATHTGFVGASASKGAAGGGAERGPFPFRFEDGPPQHLQLAFPSGMPSVPGNAPVQAPLSAGSSTYSEASVHEELYDLSLMDIPPTVPGFMGAGAGGCGAPPLPPDSFGDVPGAGANFQWAMQPTGLTDHDADVKREHIAYYFNHVRGLHFVTAAADVTCRFVLQIVAQEPAGALTDALCAMASLHSVHTQRGAAGRSAAPDTAQAQLFFNQGTYQLEAARRQGRCTQAEAMAAVHLISYSIAARGGAVAGANASAGGTEWTPMLEIACDWLAQTGMHVDDNPRLFVMNMSLPAAFSAKIIMCMDIFMGVTLQQPPRLLALYRRLLTATGVPHHIWAGVNAPGMPEWELYVPLLVGCTEQVLLAFAEIAALAHWKAHEARSGKLSARELIMRGTAIERTIRQSALDPKAFSEGGRILQVNEETCRRILATILQEAALMYLNMVLSGNNPGVPEIQNALNNILNLLALMPMGRMDLGLVLPLAFAGFMADAPAARDMLRKRLRHVGAQTGSANIRQIETVMLDVWARRDAGRREVEWRELMQERGLTLMMI
ncbi:fungal-specific transcription factor domain-containing protein [Gloeopeniophorella convolvens]|nr:fungal-specific transcription factor domain-containing protein [Gloeopeniophorella convolvens]